MKKQRVVFDEIWILKDIGLLAFHCTCRSSSDGGNTLKNDLFASFLSAITFFAKEATGDEILSLRLKDKYLYQAKKGDLIACALVPDLEHDPSEVNRLLEEILIMYMSMYQSSEDVHPTIVKRDPEKDEKILSFIKKILGIEEETRNDELLTSESLYYHEETLKILQAIESGEINQKEANKKINELYSRFDRLSDQEKLQVAEMLEDLERVIDNSSLPKETKKRLKKVKDSLSLKLRLKKWLDNF